MPKLLNLPPARILLTLREWFDYKISHCVISRSVPCKFNQVENLSLSNRIRQLLCQKIYQVLVSAKDPLIVSSWFSGLTLVLSVTLAETVEPFGHGQVARHQSIVIHILWSTVCGCNTHNVIQILWSCDSQSVNFYNFVCLHLQMYNFDKTLLW